MTVIKRPDSKFYRYNFTYKGHRYSQSTGLTRVKDAQQFEDHLIEKMRRRDAGLEDAAPGDTPLFSEWADKTLDWQEDVKGIKRPDVVENTLRMVLSFWGQRPTKTPPVEGGEYRNLRLGDPIADPDLIVEFDDYMDRRGISGTRKNTYRSACSMMYRVAMLPKYRKLTGITRNPFRDIPREKTRRRTKTITVDELATLMATAPLPVAIGVAIGTLTPALRLANVVELKRKDHIAPDLSLVSVPHKADGETGEPLVIALPVRIQQLMKRVFELYPDDPYVVPLVVGQPQKRKRRARMPRGARYWQFLKLFKAAMLAAGINYGRKDKNGVTFHSLRHTTNTNMARWGVSRDVRRVAGGHTTTAMTDWYTHISGTETVAAAVVIDEKMGGLIDVLETRLGPAAASAKPVQA